MNRTFIESVKYRPVNLYMNFGAAFLYLLNRLVLIRVTDGWFHFFAKCYFNDLVCLPFFLAYAEIFLIWIDREITSFPGLLALGLSAGLFWEAAGPHINPRSVSDPVDMLFYFFGICIYFLVLKRSIHHRQHPHAV